MNNINYESWKNYPWLLVVFVPVLAFSIGLSLATNANSNIVEETPQSAFAYYDPQATFTECTERAFEKHDDKHTNADFLVLHNGFILQSEIEICMHLFPNP